MNEHIKNIFNECKVWSSTYWRLWSQCHFLYCYMCCTMYAVAFSDCCPYHPQQPHFYPMEQFQTTNSPIGKLLCFVELIILTLICIFDLEAWACRPAEGKQQVFSKLLCWLILSSRGRIGTNILSRPNIVLWKQRQRRVILNE